MDEHALTSRHSESALRQLHAESVERLLPKYASRIDWPRARLQEGAHGGMRELNNGYASSSVRINHHRDHHGDRERCGPMAHAMVEGRCRFPGQPDHRQAVPRRERPHAHGHRPRHRIRLG